MRCRKAAAKANLELGVLDADRAGFLRSASALIQMIGRGLRTVSLDEHPGVLKTDCIVLDFGTSTLLHGSFEQDVDLNGRESTGEAPTKDCPECGAVVPLATTECPLCGHHWERDQTGEATPLGEFVM